MNDDRSCAELETLFDDYVDGRLSPAPRREVRRHLDGCERCRRRVASRERLLAAARDLPRSLEPPADLWPGIEARLEERARSAVRPVASGRGWRRAAWLGQLAAAVLLMVLGGVLSQLIWPRGDSRPETARAAADAAGAAVARADFELAEAEYLRAKESLWLLVYERRGGFSPATREVVEHNLRIIDGAIRELRQALAEDPGNRTLEGLLYAEHRRSLDLLQRLAQASRET